MVYEKYSGYLVIYCQKRESNRKWSVRIGKYPHEFLKSSVLRHKEKHVHVNFDIFKILFKKKPDVIISAGGFNPTMIFAFLWAKLFRLKHIVMTDGWIGSESNLSVIHRAVRKLVFKYSSAFIGASIHSLELYRSYGCLESALFQSHLCIDNDLYRISESGGRHYDVMFSGQFIERKMPLFFAGVAKLVKEQLGHCRVLLLGDGPLKIEIISQLENQDIDYDYMGFVDQERLPSLYNNSKLFLFPTLNDPWGVVANEACAAGVPVITCRNAGVSNDLVIDDYNGYILELDEEKWAKKVVEVLSDRRLWAELSANAYDSVKTFEFTNAAKGIVDAIEYVS